MHRLGAVLRLDMTRLYAAWNEVGQNDVDQVHTVGLC